MSPGCLNCYAEEVARRFSGPGQPYEGLVKQRDGKSLAQWNGEGRYVSEKLLDPIRWQRPRRIFVNSTSDLFFDAFTIYQIAEVFAVMLLTPQHTYQVLTKRPERMHAVLTDPQFYRLVLGYADIIRAQRPKLPNVGISDPTKFPAKWIWLGVSCENQAAANERIPLLLRTPAAVRFVSAEPLIGHINFRAVVEPGGLGRDALVVNDPGSPSCAPERHLDWVIVGGESGNDKVRIRGCELGWLRSIVKQCADAGTACFVKQLGRYPYETRPAEGGAKGTEEALARFGERHPQRDWFGPGWCLTHMPDGTSSWVKSYRLKDKKGGDMAEWPEDLRVRLFPGDRS